jgi:multidrug efflux system membrane fusion protein
VDVGNVVSSSGPDGGSKLLVIQRFDPIYVDFTITEQELLDVRNYMAAAGKLKTQVWIPEDEKHLREGELTFLDNAVLPGAGTVKLRATLANSDGHFWPGQFVKVRLVLDTKKGAVLVPARAQQIGQQGPYVYVVTQGEVENPATKAKQNATIAQLRPISPGQPQGDMLVIDQGVKAGEQVVIEGQLSVTPGGKVQVMPAPPAAPGPNAPTSQPAVAQGNAKP